MGSGPRVQFGTLSGKPFGQQSVFLLSNFNNEEELKKIAVQEQKNFSFNVLAAATKDFSFKLGEGGFGPVYKGKLDDGREIAVKKLSRCSKQGNVQFMNEAKLLARVQHRNVVNLLGYCVNAEEKLLVYEYVANESLDKLVFESKRRNAVRREELEWMRRYGIICGVARGLLYLHEGSHIPIIHRDIKAGNILLDDKWVPKIADFGMARLFPEDQTHVNTRVAGTNGYMAPEYVMHGHLSTKADVFSFGVVVLELIAGRKNSTFGLDLECESLIDWAWKLHTHDRSLEIIDPKLASSSSSKDIEQIVQCIHIGLLCVQGDPTLRPAMSRVAVMLSRKPKIMDRPTRPVYPGRRYRTRKPDSSSSTVRTGESYASTSGSTTRNHTATTSAAGSRSTTRNHTATTSAAGSGSTTRNHTATTSAAGSGFTTRNHTATTTAAGSGFTTRNHTATTSAAGSGSTTRNNTASTSAGLNNSLPADPKGKRPMES